MDGIDMDSVYWGGVAIILVMGGGLMSFLRGSSIGNNCGDLVEGIGTENETRAYLNEGVRTYRILAEERGKTIKILMNQLKEIGEDYRQKCEEVKGLKKVIVPPVSFKAVDATELPLRVLKRDLSKTGWGQEEEKG